MTLSVRDLTITRGGLPVLSGLSFDLPPGRALILRGPNGAGKTTLLRTLAGLQPVAAGHVTCDPDQIAYSGHLDGIKSMLSVRENLQFWAAVFGTYSISDALDAYNLNPLEDRLAGTLSAGQKRRLGLARMCVTGRSIWAMDEPTVSLDAEAVGWFASTVARHLAAGGSAVIATHIDLGLASADTLDVSPFRARMTDLHSEDEIFL